MKASSLTCVLGFFLLGGTVIHASTASGADKVIKPQIRQVMPGVQVAIGYALGNIIMIEGPDGVILIDTTENQPTAIALVEEMRTFANNKSVKGIIITHHHSDHINGAAALLKFYEEDKIEVYAHSSTDRAQYEYTNLLRGAYQFGAFLNNSGPGATAIDRSIVYKTVKPTITYDEAANFTCAGIKFELLHIPGETYDHTGVWIAEKKLLMSGDDIYQAFPNLYSIRGTRPRDVRQWYHSIDLMRYKHADVLIPSHTIPYEGTEKIFDIMTVYRDGIQFVHDQTIRLMNQNYYVDDIVRKVALPPVLAKSPYLQEYYGTVAWSVRGIFDANVGWFSGDATDLNPLTKKERGNKMTRLLKSSNVFFSTTQNMILSAKYSLLNSKARQKLFSVPDVTELQWALEISSMAMEEAENGDKEYEWAKKVKQEALLALANASTSTNAIHYYRSIAQELEIGIDNKALHRVYLANSASSDIYYFMKVLPIRLDPNLCNDTERVALQIVLTNHNSKKYGYILRHCVIEFQTEFIDKMGHFDAKIHTTENVWKSVVLFHDENKRPLKAAIATKEIVVEYGLEKLYKFMSVIEPLG